MVSFALVGRHEIARHLKELGPFPAYSAILTPQHFYQNDVLMRYSQQTPHPVSLRQLAGYGKVLSKQKILALANFVRLELPIRLAMRIRDLQTLPFGVVNNFHLAQVYESYYHLFNAFRKMRSIDSMADNDAFCESISALLDQHVFNLSHLLMGAMELTALRTLPQQELDSFMSLMLRSRISRRVIVEQHLSLTEIYKARPYQRTPPDYIGEIFHSCVAEEQLRRVGELVRELLADVYDQDNMPDVNVEGDVGASFPFMVPHLHFLFGEILRNSFEAVIRVHGALGGKLPPVKVTIVDSKTQVMFRFSDVGGGLHQSQLDLIYLFGKSPDVAAASLANFHNLPGVQLHGGLQVTAGGSSIIKPRLQTAADDIHEISTRTKKLTLEQLITRPHRYKLGLGLPMCKVYADYWNGDLSMNSLEGYGSDTCLVLSKLGVYQNTNQLDRA